MWRLKAKWRIKKFSPVAHQKCNAPAHLKKKKKKKWSDFLPAWAPPTYPLILHHSFSLKISPLWPASSPLFSLCSLFIFVSNTQQSSLTLPPVHHSTATTVIFQWVLLKKLHKNLLSSYISSYLRYELLYFCGFSYFARGFCNLSFESDILVIIFMSFALVDLFGW